MEDHQFCDACVVCQYDWGTLKGEISVPDKPEPTTRAVPDSECFPDDMGDIGDSFTREREEEVETKGDRVFQSVHTRLGADR